ncbi:hypothetical protein Lesp02_83170 [Lentzea sp. NBRC 105346]|uniref:FAD-dependent oxidoreductase n=1 Tax=Lentzea sp. NBRC 105346 TaxID=3032205 RepID=UPI0024A334B9|nr:NAD(P)-binding protein [Lentzea sp. NBRC 105346]GLZ36130.1 hypothetical protein Lesp02_83170 [Lentzea sp. NBRC 105346]
MPAALVVGAGPAGLVTAYRLRRSDWDVVVVERSSAPPVRPVALTGFGLDAARRMRLPLDLAELRKKLDVRCDTTIVRREPDRFGVTVTFSTGDVEWFDLVVDPEIRFAGMNDSMAIYAAELFGDAFDIFRDPREALRWWYTNCLKSPEQSSF